MVLGVVLACALITIRELRQMERQARKHSHRRTRR